MCPAHWCMSSQHEVFIRILALLQRKTFIETKNHTLKCLKRHYSTVQSMKNVTVLTKDGAFALFFPPHPGGFDSSRVPIPREFAIQGQNLLMLGVSPGLGWGWAQLELTDALISQYHLSLIQNAGFFTFVVFHPCEPVVPASQLF